MKSSFERWHLGQLSEVGQPVVVEETPLDAVARDDCDAAATARTAVAVDGQRDALPDELDALLLVHSLAVVGVHEAVQVGAAGTADGGGLADESATDGDGVDLK